MSTRNWSTQAGHWLINRAPVQKLLIAMTVDSVVLASAAALTIVLIGPHTLLPESPHFLVVVMGPPLFLLSLLAFGGYRVVLRYVGLDSLARFVYASLTATLVLCVMHWAIGILEQDWKAIILFGITAASALTLVRTVASYLLHPALQVHKLDRVIIYGAGSAGMQLAATLHASQKYRPIGFVDNLPALQGRLILGLPVYAPSALEKLKRTRPYDFILLAIPSLDRRRRRELLESLEKLAVKVMVMPRLDELDSGEKRPDELRAVQVEDLLGRDPVKPEPSLLDLYIRDKTVMVTGAGGSIGSELCRQALQRNPRKLVLFEQSEYGLYEIERELRAPAAQTGCELVAVLGNVTDSKQLRLALTQHQTNTIYHAAAYKHVPLVEQNILSAVHNNVFGTLHTIQTAQAMGVSNFVLISTDKAVRPTSVMGASKRVCELIIQALAATAGSAMRLSMVRFGNVLASSGSVVPLFLEQIQSGGPVTVTHPETTRYFMTIQEAAQLVIQAGAMGGKGEVFVLDMGRPVRILELANRMIHLSGLETRTPENPNGDISIEFTGLRPGEKLFEELLIGKNPQGTGHPRIFLAHEDYLPWETLRPLLQRIQREMDVANTAAVVTELRQIVAGFEAKPEKLAVHEIIQPLPSTVAGTARHPNVAYLPLTSP